MLEQLRDARTASNCRGTFPPQLIVFYCCAIAHTPRHGARLIHRVSWALSTAAGSARFAARNGSGSRALLLLPTFVPPACGHGQCSVALERLLAVVLLTAGVCVWAALRSCWRLMCSATDMIGRTGLMFFFRLKALFAVCPRFWGFGNSTKSCSLFYFPRPRTSVT